MSQFSKYHRLENKVEFGFWCLRYAFTFVIFILGIKAPGISTVRDYYSRYSDTEVIFSFNSSKIWTQIISLYNVIVQHKCQFFSIYFSTWYETKKGEEKALQKIDHLLIGKHGKSLLATCAYWCPVSIKRSNFPNVGYTLNSMTSIKCKLLTNFFHI